MSQYSLPRSETAYHFVVLAESDYGNFAVERVFADTEVEAVADALLHHLVLEYSRGITSTVE